MLDVKLIDLLYRLTVFYISLNFRDNVYYIYVQYKTPLLLKNPHFKNMPLKTESKILFISLKRKPTVIEIRKSYKKS